MCVRCVNFMSMLLTQSSMPVFNIKSNLFVLFSPLPSAAIRFGFGFYSITVHLNCCSLFFAGGHSAKRIAYSLAAEHKCLWQNGAGVWQARRLGELLD